MKKVVLALAVLFIFVGHGMVEAQQDEPEGNFRWQADGNGVRIRNYTGNSTDVRIPSHIQGKPVVSIGPDSFKGKRLTNVIIPNTVVSIVREAFKNNNLTTVTIPNTVISIGGGAFMNNRLTSVVIPGSVRSINEDAFKNNNLTTVTIPNTVVSIGDGAFMNNRLTSVVIPGSVRYLGNGAFKNNNLTSVTISHGVEHIYPWAFQNNRLTNVTIPDSIHTIDTLAFAGNQITSVNLPTNTKLNYPGIGHPFGNATVTRGQQQVAQQQTQPQQQQVQSQPQQQVQQQQQIQPSSAAGVDARFVGTWSGIGSLNIRETYTFYSDGNWQSEDANGKDRGKFTVSGHILELRTTHFWYDGSWIEYTPSFTIGWEFRFPNRDRLVFRGSELRRM